MNIAHETGYSEHSLMVLTVWKYRRISAEKTSTNSYSGDVVDKGHHHLRRVMSLHDGKPAGLGSGRSPGYLSATNNGYPISLHR